MIKTVFLDVDGVLADFRRGVCEAFNKPYDYPTSPEDWTFWKDWDGVTSTMVNAKCTVDFWANLKWMHDGRDILKAVANKFDNIYLLTTPMPNVKSATGKWLWVSDNLPTYYKRTIITQAPKSLLARPDTLLIDDKDENIDGFIKANGRGLLVPRPWNRAHFCADRTIQIVRKFLEDLGRVPIEPEPRKAFSDESY